MSEDGSDLTAGGGYRAWAEAGARALRGWYDDDTGLWTSTGWWNSANALNAVVHYTQRTRDETYLADIANTFTKAQTTHRDFVNDYYDDNGWWALCWVDAYDLTGQLQYLEMAKTIFTANAAAWDDNCGGGIWWSTARAYKNAITNELLLSLAVALHLRTPRDGGEGSYLESALREWSWFQSTGMINAQGLVNDGLDAECANNGGITWTYNQGVILGGLAGLFQATGDRTHLIRAESIADAALAHLTGADGILADPCETTGSGCDADQTQFKGIFVRNLYSLYIETGKPAYRDFILRNARSIWNRARDASGRFGLRWSGPFDIADASRQSSALDALNAAVGVLESPAS